MTIKKAARSQGKTKQKKLTLKREKLADLSPRGKAADLLRGQSFTFGGGHGNHNETFVRAGCRR